MNLAPMQVFVKYFYDLFKWDFIVNLYFYHYFFNYAKRN